MSDDPLEIEICPRHGVGSPRRSLHRGRARDTRQGERASQPRMLGQGWKATGQSKNKTLISGDDSAVWKSNDRFYFWFTAIQCYSAFLHEGERNTCEGTMNN
jgi:hypothetical protein